MLDLSFVEQVLIIHGIARGGIEDFFLDLRMDGELGAYHGDELLPTLLVFFLFQLLEILEELLNLFVVFGQKRDGVLALRGGAGRRAGRRGRRRGRGGGAGGATRR